MVVFDTDLTPERIRLTLEGGYWRNESVEVRFMLNRLEELFDWPDDRHRRRTANRLAAEPSAGDHGVMTRGGD